MAEPKLTVAKDTVVTMDYTLSLDDGAMFETTRGGMPLRFLAGHGQLLPALEDALMGMGAGDQASLTLAPEDGYGAYDEDAFEAVPIDAFPSTDELLPGTPVGVHDSSGETYEAYVTEIRDDEVLLDFNHPLAGETLHFQVQVVDVRPATAEELEHGHVHGDGHHHD